MPRSLNPQKGMKKAFVKWELGQQEGEPLQ